VGYIFGVSDDWFGGAGWTVELGEGRASGEYMPITI